MSARAAIGPAVVALAGRRIDIAGASPARFPLENVERVAARIAVGFQRVGAVALVCSAACGADLIALDLAASRGMRRCIVLPFAAHRFEVTSVRDRPGDWSAAFWRHIDATEHDGSLIILPTSGDDERDYHAATVKILEVSHALAKGFSPEAELYAFAVWDSAPRPVADATMAFLKLATLQRVHTVTVPSL
jgi:hypothetical protein